MNIPVHYRYECIPVNKKLKALPADWKLANVNSICKGVREDPGDYGTVSLTSVPGKIMEKIILGTIERHLKSNTVISHRQHGFTKVKS